MAVVRSFACLSRAVPFPGSRQSPKCERFGPLRTEGCSLAGLGGVCAGVRKTPFSQNKFSQVVVGRGRGEAASATRLKAAGTKLRFDIVRKAGLTSIY